MESNIRTFILRILFAAFGSVFIGYIVFGTLVFAMDHPVFQFVAFGLAGSIVLATAKLTSIRKSFTVLALIVIIHEILLKPFGAVLIVRDILFLVGIGTTIILFTLFFHKRLIDTRSARPLVLGAMLAINAIIITTILRYAIPFFFEGNQTPSGATFENLGLGFLIGIGLGLGDEIFQMTFDRRLILQSKTT